MQLRADILRWVGNGPFCFFFVDPKGWTEVGVSTLEPLLRRPKSEFLINLMYDFVNRTMSIGDREPVEKLQQMVRARNKASRKQEITGTGDLFGAESFFNSDAGHAGAAEVDRFWHTYLKKGPKTIDTHAFATILEDTDWFESDLDESLMRLIKAGKVTNLSADAARRTRHPLHYAGQGETLKWTGPD